MKHKIIYLVMDYSLTKDEIPNHVGVYYGLLLMIARYFY